MTTARATLHGPVHHVIAGRTICGGSPASLPPGDAPSCRQCERSLERARRSREERA